MISKPKTFRHGERTTDMMPAIWSDVTISTQNVCKKFDKATFLFASLHYMHRTRAA
jgi:hypothetical protein